MTESPVSDRVEFVLVFVLVVVVVAVIVFVIVLVLGYDHDYEAPGGAPIAPGTKLCHPGGS